VRLLTYTITFVEPEDRQDVLDTYSSHPEKMRQTYLAVMTDILEDNGIDVENEHYAIDVKVLDS
jgi:hypothetical protein